MKFITALILVLIFTYAAYLYAPETPWWFFAIGAFLAGMLVPQTGWANWLAGFVGVFGLWLFLIWQIDGENHSILSVKMAIILPLGGSTATIMLVTAAMGGLVGGMASLTGTFLRRSVG